MPSSQDMMAEAERCRRLMREIDDPSVRSTLAQLADYYDRQAALERSLEKRSFDADES